MPSVLGCLPELPSCNLSQRCHGDTAGNTQPEIGQARTQDVLLRVKPTLPPRRLYVKCRLTLRRVRKVIPGLGLPFLCRHPWSLDCALTLHVPKLPVAVVMAPMTWFLSAEDWILGFYFSLGHSKRCTLGQAPTCLPHSVPLCGMGR